MALKIYCDRCKKEISDQTKNYRKVYFMFGEDGDTEEWDFCPDCFLSVKRSVINNLTLLKEQEAVEPTLIREGRNKNYNDYVCPRCDNEVVYEQNYCSECGVRFLWEGSVK